MTALAEIWSLSSAPLTPMDPKDGNKLLLNALLSIRWMAYDCALVATRVPASNSRLITEGTACGYHIYTQIIPLLQSGLLARGETLPPFPDCKPDYADEAKIDQQRLLKALLPHLEPPMKRWMEFFHSCQEEGQHWSSFVSFHWITWGLVYDSLLALKSAGTGGIMTYNRMLLEDERLRPYCQALMGEGMQKVLAVMNDELPKLRAAADETGWREEEAKSLLMESYKFSAGSYDVELMA